MATKPTGKGLWKNRPPFRLQSLVAMGRARQEGEMWRAV